LGQLSRQGYVFIFSKLPSPADSIPGGSSLHILMTLIV
jgi:hypothetical protein